MKGEGEEMAVDRSVVDEVMGGQVNFVELLPLEGEMLAGLKERKVTLRQIIDSPAEHLPNLAENERQNIVRIARRIKGSTRTDWQDGFSWIRCHLFQHYFASNQIAFLDIQTNGLPRQTGWPNIKILTIVLYDGRDLKYYVQGRNMQNFKPDISRYKAIATFNGREFDLPIIRWRQKMNFKKQVHFDLMLMLRGSFQEFRGLKPIKEGLEVAHEKLRGMNGLHSKVLWREFQGKNVDALKLLLAYNAEDVVPLVYIAQYYFNEINRREDYGFQPYELEETKSKTREVLEEFFDDLHLDMNIDWQARLLREK